MSKGQPKKRKNEVYRVGKRQRLTIEAGKGVAGTDQLKAAMGCLVNFLPGSILIFLEKSDTWIFIGNLHLHFFFFFATN